MQTLAKKILGIDPGYGRLGWAVIKGNGLLEAGCLETSKDQPHEKRLKIIGRGLEDIIKKHKPDALAIEKLFINTNQKTATKVAETRGVILYMARDLPIYEFSPPEVKLAICGYGRADKKQVAKMARLIFKTDKSLKDDALDAIAIAFTASGRLFTSPK